MDFEVLIMGSDANAYYMARCYHEEYGKIAHLIGAHCLSFTQYTNILTIEYNPKIWAHFRENELYWVTIETYGRNASYIEYLANDCGIFAKEKKKKYGEPDYLRTNVSILDFRNHQLNIASFSIGAKEIWIGLLEDDSEYKYYISIKNKSFPKKKHIPTEEELKKQKEQDKKNKELRDNSF